MSDASLELMAKADRLTGVRPGMAPGEIRARLESSTAERQLAIYLCDLLRQTRDSAERAEIRGRMDTLVAENGHLRTLIKQQLTNSRIVYTPEKPPAPAKKYASEQVRRRESMRRWRAARKARDGDGAGGVRGVAGEAAE